jgi:hypothetical protein
MKLLAACSMTATATILLVVACGGGSGSASLPDGSDGSADGSTTPEGSTSGEAGPGSSLCPTAVPAAGTACTTSGLTCELGGTGPQSLCSTVFTCNGSNKLTWFVSPPAQSCVRDQAHNPSACPATFGGLANGTACPAGLTGTCVYDEGLCGCAACAGDSGVSGTTQQFSCKAYPKPAGCPEPRPAIGDACSTDKQACEYGGVCSVLAGLPSLSCENGHWSRRAIGVLCAQQTCGTVN